MIGIEEDTSLVLGWAFERKDWDFKRFYCKITKFRNALFVGLLKRIN